MKGIIKPSSKKIIICLSLLFGVSHAYAGGFQLFEQSISSLGNAYAGAAAVAENATTAWYNPAGLTLLDNVELDGVANLINLNSEADFKSSVSNSIIGEIIGQDPQPVTGGHSTELGTDNFVPAVHVALPYCHRFAFGLSITSPFGLNTVYDGSSQARYLATISKVKTIDVGPSVAFQATPQLSVGAGVDIQYLKAELDQKVPVGPNVPEVFGGPFPDGNFVNHATDKKAYGFNVGALYQLNCGHTRIGVDYRSRVVHHLEGDAHLTLPEPLVFADGGVTAHVTLPDSANLSVYHEVNRCWALLGSINYTHWSVIPEVTLNYSGPIIENIEKVNLALNFKDTYRYALGVNFSPNCRWKFRAGVAYDESPVRGPLESTFRLPDDDRYWAAVGAEYKISRCLSVDAGYSHLFVKDTSVDQSESIPLATGQVLFDRTVADVTSDVNIVGVQVNWKIM